MGGGAAGGGADVTGVATTSNVGAGRLYGVPTAGTAAHAFVLLHDSERHAFASQLESSGPETTLLVDTHDVERAVRIAVELAGPSLGAVRIDSGDLGVVARSVRAQLDSLGATGTRIRATSQLGADAIHALAAAHADG